MTGVRFIGSLDRDESDGAHGRWVDGDDTQSVRQNMEIWHYWLYN